MNIEYLKAQFEGCPLVKIPGTPYKLVVNPVTEQEPEATDPKVLKAVAEEFVKKSEAFAIADKIFGEEDKGAVYVAATSLETNLPFGIARWTNSGINWKQFQSFDFEYGSKRLYIFGVKAGDKVVVIDDLVSTGGTMIAMLKSLQREGVEILDVLAIADKVEYKGLERIKKETGFGVKTLFSISVGGEKCKVVN